MLTILLACAAPPFARATTFTVTDADFSGDLYRFQYFSGADRVLVNGGLVGNGLNPTRTNNGFNSGGGDATGPTSGVNYWMANGEFAATQTIGALRMGFDFSAVSGHIASVQLRSSAFLFQFGGYEVAAQGDHLFGRVATPASFGTGSFTTFFEVTGTGSNSPSALGTFALVDITGSLAANWLNTPGLFELEYGYEQTPDPTIPGRHLQLFRTSYNSDQLANGFELVVKLDQTLDAQVDEPATLALLGIGLLGVITARRRRNKSRAD